MTNNNLQVEFTPPHPLKTAVLFLVFNRLDTTKQVFEAIRQAQPPRLYIAADGARRIREGEKEKVEAVRNYILNNIDWECEVKTLFREENLGCKIAVSSAITWFFSNEEMGIILEDDCLPTQSFFWFCEELLERYKNSEEIYLVSGDGRATSKIDINHDYSFVKYSLIWGWASWKRAWKQYDVTISDWDKQKNNMIKNLSQNKDTRRHWQHALQNVHDGKIDTWDYQFAYLLFKNHGVCIVPKINFISNVGFGDDATHTVDSNCKNANIPNFNIFFPLNHPDEIILNNQLNKYYDEHEFTQKSIIVRAFNKLGRMLIGRNILK
jgi:hypothetical protein